ncbi:centromere protein F [Agrilus planipennis]|uniref:Centromere protein F n=1 Tax=Agrilus planipennis TaxID=224129 RepID=A0A1W4WR90_AGRPL|nr:centromere protein F [Agrilus planipennis]XP_018326427.1 centromere protein F [Agrilus planipennis]
MENIDLSKNNGPCLDTVRVLHQTIISLRKALEQSKSEIVQLKQKAFPVESVQDCLSTLTIENHVLKTHILTKQEVCCLSEQVLKKGVRNVATETNSNISKLEKGICHNNRPLDPIICGKTNLSTTIFKTGKPEENKLDSLTCKPQTSEASGYDTNERLVGDSFLKPSLKRNLGQSPKKNVIIKIPRLEVTGSDSSEEELSELQTCRQQSSDTSTKLEKKAEKHSEIANDYVDKETEHNEKSVEENVIDNIESYNELKEKVPNLPNVISDITQSDNIEADKQQNALRNSIETVKKFEQSADLEEDNCKEKITVIVDNISPQKVSTSLEDLFVSKTSDNLKSKNLAISKIVSFSNISDIKKTVKFLDNSFEVFILETNENTMTEKTGASKIAEIPEATHSLEKSVTHPTDIQTSSNEDKIIDKVTVDEVHLPSIEDPQYSPSEETSSESKRKEKINPSKVEEILKDNQTLLRRSQVKSMPENLQSQSKTSLCFSSSLDNPESQSDGLEPSTKETSLENQLPSFEISESELKEIVEDESLNVFQDSASTPSTVKERSVIKNDGAELFQKFESVQNMSLNNELDQNEEVDDIELIFTTDDTKDSDFKEELVPIETSDNMQHLQCPNAGNDTDNNLSFEMSDRELDDEVFNEVADGSKCSECNPQMCNSKSDTSINQEERSLKSCYSCQDSSFENRSFDKEESFDQFNEKVQIIETDISKCGIVDVDFSVTRRNTCPNPLPYRPIIHREAVGKGLNIRKGRPILGQSTAARRDSGAQTDITALPNTFWRSESSLAHKIKVGENFATLPSKLPLPCSRIRLSEKTVEARRVLLSDIGFTSMVPELSRSADHLGPDTLQTPTPVQYGQFLRAPDLYSPSMTSQKFNWTTIVSPLEMSRSGSHSRYNSIYPLSPPVPSRRCSAPVSPSRRPYLKHTSKVRFANGSLPELRVDWNSTGDSGDSTDSLVDEAESFLRRSIDCLTSRRDYHRVKGSRRASAPEPCRDSIPLDWHPFLPRTPHDLRHEHWVKVIVPGDGKVRGGRVRYVGPVAGQTDQYVGVQLSTPDGHSDGVFHNRRYFSCEPHHAVFVPFKKVIMGWKP